MAIFFQCRFQLNEAWFSYVKQILSLKKEKKIVKVAYLSVIPRILFLLTFLEEHRRGKCLKTHDFLDIFLTNLKYDKKAAFVLIFSEKGLLQRYA